MIQLVKFNKGIYANQILYLLIVTMGHSTDPMGIS